MMFSSRRVFPRPVKEAVPHLQPLLGDAHAPDADGALPLEGRVGRHGAVVSGHAGGEADAPAADPLQGVLHLNTGLDASFVAAEFITCQRNISLI